MSPEQAANQERIDARSDIYSVGAVAYFLLTGQPPFAYASPAEVLAAHVNELPSSLSQHRSDIPSDLEAVVLCCLARPAERYGDAGSLGIALASCQRPDAGAAPGGTGAVTLKFDGRNSGQAGDDDDGRDPSCKGPRSIPSMVRVLILPSGIDGLEMVGRRGSNHFH